MINWDDWIPPVLIPERMTVNGVIHKGDVWGFNDGEKRAVIRCDAEGGGYATILAGDVNGQPTCGFYANAYRITFSLLICRAGEEPPDPDILYQFLYT